MSTQAKPLSAEEIEGVRAAIKCGGYHDGMNVHRMFATIEALTAKQGWDVEKVAFYLRDWFARHTTDDGVNLDHDILADELTAQFTPPSQGWQPIETAPKDGTEIWVYGGEWFDDAGGGFGGDGPLNRVTSAYWKRDGWCMGYTGDGYNAEMWANSPTHWQPKYKPAPPTASPPEAKEG